MEEDLCAHRKGLQDMSRRKKANFGADGSPRPVWVTRVLHLCVYVLRYV